VDDLTGALVSGDLSALSRAVENLERVGPMRFGDERGPAPDSVRHRIGTAQRLLGG
jgi:hypothetical protein